MATSDVTFLSGALSVLITDLETMSIATSLLFNHALSIGNADGCTTIVRPDPLAALPLRLFDSPKQPPVHLIRKTEFLYLPDRSDFVEYVAGVYESGAPACFIVDSMETYRADSASGLASILALLHDVGVWIKEKRNIAEAGRGLSPVVCALSIDQSKHEKIIRLAERYTSDIFRLHAAEEEGEFLYYGRGDEKRLTLKIQNEQIVHLA